MTAMPSHFLARGLATAMAPCLIATAGCSWLFVQKRPPPPVEAAPPVQCTSSAAAPILDTVFASLYGLGGAAAVVAGAVAQGGDSLDVGLGKAQIAMGALWLAAGVALAFSAAHGYAAISDCRELKAAQQACFGGFEASCAALRGPGLTERVPTPTQ